MKTEPIKDGSPQALAVVLCSLCVFAGLLFGPCHVVSHRQPSPPRARELRDESPFRLPNYRMPPPRSDVEV